MAQKQTCGCNKLYIAAPDSIREQDSSGKKRQSGERAGQSGGKMRGMES